MKPRSHLAPQTVTQLATDDGPCHGCSVELSVILPLKMALVDAGQSAKTRSQATLVMGRVYALSGAGKWVMKLFLCLGPIANKIHATHQKIQILNNCGPPLNNLHLRPKFFNKSRRVKPHRAERRRAIISCEHRPSLGNT